MTSEGNDKFRKYLIDILRWIIIILSILLIVFISVDTFTGVNFLESRRYMTFQFWVCVIFMADFFIELTLSANRWGYVRSHFLYFLLSIPYLNLIDILHIHLTPEQLFFVRFIPLARGVMAMTIVVGAISENKLTSFLMSYIVSLASFIYLGSLLFYYCESGVNTAVTDFGLALWWACMNATTLGCDIYPVTVTGKILGCILSVGGIIMFPLFTVYITALIRQYTKPQILSAINSHRTQKIVTLQINSNAGQTSLRLKCKTRHSITEIMEQTLTNRPGIDRVIGHLCSIDEMRHVCPTRGGEGEPLLSNTEVCRIVELAPDSCFPDFSPKATGDSRSCVLS